MKVRRLTALGFQAGFDPKGQAVLTLPALQIPAASVEAFDDKAVADGMRQTAERLKAAANKLSPAVTSATGT